jgi:hypothetical protein
MDSWRADTFPRTPFAHVCVNVAAYSLTTTTLPMAFRLAR